MDYLICSCCKKKLSINNFDGWRKKCKKCHKKRIDFLKQYPEQSQRYHKNIKEYHRICPKCKRELHQSLFSDKASWCKGCNAEYARNKRKENPEKYRIALQKEI